MGCRHMESPLETVIPFDNDADHVLGSCGLVTYVPSGSDSRSDAREGGTSHKAE